MDFYLSCNQVPKLDISKKKEVNYTPLPSKMLELLLSPLMLTYTLSSLEK